MKKYYLEILSLVMLGMISACAVFCKQLGLVQRVMLGYMFLFTLHEWEENRIPGGFSALMAGFFGIWITEDQEAAAHIPVGLLLILITFIPFFTQSGLIALIPVYLGIFEAIVHVAGIKLHRMDKPYTPGMITALCLCAASVCVLIVFSRRQIVRGAEFAWGVLLMFLCFFAMQRSVIAIFRLSYKDLVKTAKGKIKEIRRR